jgi:hypothetical protein
MDYFKATQYTERTVIVYEECFDESAEPVLDAKQKINGVIQLVSCVSRGAFVDLRTRASSKKLSQWWNHGDNEQTGRASWKWDDGSADAQNLEAVKKLPVVEMTPDMFQRPSNPLDLGSSTTKEALENMFRYTGKTSFAACALLIACGETDEEVRACLFVDFACICVLRANIFFWFHVCRNRVFTVRPTLISAN